MGRVDLGAVRHLRWRGKSAWKCVRAQAKRGEQDETGGGDTSGKL